MVYPYKRIDEQFLLFQNMMIDIGWSTLFHYRIPLLDFGIKLGFYHFMKTGKIVLTSDLCFIRNTYVTLVESSIKDTNHFTPTILWIRVGPQTLVWIRVNGIKHILFLGGNDTRWCLANSHASQWKLWISSFPNIVRNILFNKEKDGWPRRKWDNQTWDSEMIPQEMSCMRLIDGP